MPHATPLTAPKTAAQFGPLSAALALPRVDAAPRVLLNRLYRRQPPWPLLLRERRAWLQWAWSPAAAAAPSFARYALRLGPARGWLLLEPRAQAALLDERHAERLPHALRCMLLSDVLAAVIATVEQASGERFEWTLAEEGPPQEAAAWCASFSFHWDGAPEERHGGCLELDTPAALATLATAGPPLDPQAPRLGALRVPIVFELGRTLIALRELRRIERGDIVAIERWRGSGRGLAVHTRIGRQLRLGGTALAEGSHITLAAHEEITMTDVDIDQPPASSTAGLDRLDDLEVSLRFEVGELAMSLRELRGLAPGHVFDLGQPLNRCAVRIFAHGNLLGHGHLVAIGDQLGVRVAEFAADAHE